MKPLRLASASLLLSLTISSAAPSGLTVCIGEQAAQQSRTEWNAAGHIIQCLASDATEVDTLREQIRTAKAQGKVTARAFNGTTLPYVDNSVNHLVVSGSKLPRKEILRVLVPNGTAIISGKTITKPIPAGLDDWSHYHHNPEGTMVGGDTVVGPPRGLQWVGNPKWLRNHDFMSSMHAMVSSGGRIFYVIDEGLRNHIFLPSDWKLIARDAFNGTILWKHTLEDWHPSNWPLKSGPGDMPRRIVATPDTVYATAGLIEPLTAFDARTGKILRTYDGTDGTIEVIFSDGTLFVLTAPEMKPVGFRGESTGYGEIKRANSNWAWSPEAPKRVIMAIDAASGKVHWQHTSKAAPLTLTVSRQQVFFHDGESLVALDRKAGKPLWTSDPAPIKSVPTGGTLRVAYSDGVTVFALGTGMTAFDAKSGKTLWKNKLQKTSHHCPEDLFIIDGQIWSPNTGKPQQNGTHYKVFNLRTGEVDKDFVAENIKGFPMHPRCYPSRATKRFIMTNGMGTEFYEIGGTKVDVNNTVRGSCIYGIMPANGLLYKPPDSCACYYQSKLEWLCALAPVKAKAKPVKPAARLEKGPAFGKIDDRQEPGADAWPMYRRDPQRSGYLPKPVRAELGEAWKVELGSTPNAKLTQPVVAGGRVFVAAVDEHTLHALNAKSGKTIWSFTAGGRIDSSPTLHKGSVLFGCADGRVYCLRATDGALAWRYLAAPGTQQLVAFQQLESVWPLHGSLLVQNDTVYCLAGRNMFFDGGLRLALLDAKSGREISARMLDENDPETGENLQTLIAAKYMPVANADLFSSNGKNIFMQTQKFDLDGKRINVKPIQPGQETPDMAGDDHLFCQTGLLDSNWFHRSYWIYGNNCGEGWGAYAKPRASNPSGRIMTFDKTTTYGFRADPLGNMLHPRQNYVLYAMDKDPAVAKPEPPAPRKKGEKRKRKPKGSLPPAKWQAESLDLLVNAMVVTDKTLFVAGPPDMADESQMMGFLPGADDDINRQLQRQEEAWHGKHGGILQAVSTGSGQNLGKHKIDTYPIFDGLIAAEGRLFASMLDGTIRCYR